MSASSFIARRYLISKKTHNAINIISIVSVIGVAISTMALVIVLSAFNGIEKLVVEINSAYEQDIRIESNQTKTFNRDYLPQEIYQVEGLVNHTKVIEEIIIIQNEDHFVIGVMKGVEESFIEMSEMNNHLEDGYAILEDDYGPLGVIGVKALIDLDGYIASADIPFDDFVLHVPNREEKIRSANIDGFTTTKIPIVGTFSFNNRVDESVLVVPLDFAADKLNYQNEISAVEMSFEPGTDLEAKKTELSEMLGPGFKVRSHFEQNQLIYQTSKVEKLLIIVFLSFIFFMVTFTLVSSITMLVLEKRDNLQTIRALGATTKQISNIFFVEGMLINVLGLVIGLGIGYGICLIQIQFGLIYLDEELGEVFPISCRLVDFFLIILIAVGLGAFASYLPSRILIKRLIK